MTNSGPVYQRLARPAASVASYQSLWLGDDHLLLVNSTGYSEEYRRILLRDIKGILIVPSRRRFWWSLPWGILAALILMIDLSDGAVSMPGAIFLGVVLSFMAWNHLMGPGCHAYVVTGVQTALLPAPVRRPKTEKVLARIRPLIEAAQSGIEEEKLAVPSSIPPPLP